MSLSRYKSKRNFNETAEPVGSSEGLQHQSLVFVIQRHKASRLHYDFRLEMEGVLKSWAVPKGPSLNPHDKRLAMMVEDHPFDYKDFEGVIPQGNYGAGIVEIWDSGTYTSLENTGNAKKDENLLIAGLDAGNLKFILHGKKLKGEFALVKLKGREENSWLLIKHNDKYAVHDDYNSEEETRADSPINKWLAENKPQRKQPKKVMRQALAPAREEKDYIAAMLAKDTDKPFSNEDWIFEIKWDGYRAIAEVNKDKVKLYSRNGNSFLSNYPEVVDELLKLKVNAVFDGEIVVLNEEGNPDFQKLQHFAEARNYPINYYVFDLLKLNGKELYSIALIERKKLLQEVLKQNHVIKYSDHIEEHGEDFFEAVKQRNLEGIMAKKKTSQYYPGRRSGEWLKIKHHKSEEAVIVGFTEGRGGRKYFGALVLGAFVNHKFTYIGHTGSGFDTALLKQMYAKLEPVITDKSPFDERVKTNMPVTWVEPKYVCEVKFTEWTSDGKLRHPIFLRMREDKEVKDLNTDLMGSAEAEAGDAPEEERAPAETAASKPGKKAATKKVASKKAKRKEWPKKTVAKRTASKQMNEKASKTLKAAKPAPDEERKETKSDVVKNENEKIYGFGEAQLKATNRTKIYFPDEGYTKGDVLDYYEMIARLMVPYLKDRPESLFRTPNGIRQKGFFHKDAGDDAPAWVEHIPLYSDSVKKEIDYILCNNKATLLYLANLGCIEINPWHSRVGSLDNPDYMIIDIDPSDNNSFEQVIEAALVVKEVLDQAGAMSICKTSGASGMHVYVPMGARHSYDQAKDFANIVCLLANAQIPQFTTLERSLTKRSKDKIYMDYLQNRKGQTIACVYSLRPKKGATVSTPLQWKEVKKGLSPQEFTIKTIAKRADKKGDLFAPILDPKNAIDLAKCIERLGG